MSGLEVAGLAVGVIFPTVVEAIKAYSSTRKKIKTYRGYSKEVHRLYKQLNVQHQNFLNECELVLREVANESEEMMDNPDHMAWSDPHLSARLEERLNKNYQSCVWIMENIRDALYTIDEELDPFDILRREKLPSEPFKDTIRRVRKRVSIAFQKSAFEKQLQVLRDFNSDLANTRFYISQFQGERRELPTSPLVQKRVPKQYSGVQHAARTLHEALMESWRCDTPTHADHKVLLCLQAEPEANSSIRLDVAISFQQAIPALTSCLREPKNPFWLQIQSSITNIPDTAVSRDQEALRSLTMSLNVQDDDNSRAPRKRAAESDVQPELPLTNPKRRTVRFMDEQVPDSLRSAQQAPQQLASDDVPPLTNLRQRHDMCLHLQEHQCDPSNDMQHCHCLGYLEIPQKSKHLFYCPGIPGISMKPAVEPLNARSMSIADILHSVPDDQFELDRQIHLAHRLAVATLQYNSTPWMSDAWRTQDVFVLVGQPSMSASALQTMHFQNRFPEAPTNPLSTSAHGSTDDVSMSSASPSDSPLDLLYGVRNASLFSLGVALLEISQQQPLHFDGTEEEVVVVRKLARKPMRLGGRYKEIVRRCLECDFGFGNDLAKPDLQGAVYGQVVCQLDEMMRKLCFT